MGDNFNPENYETVQERITRFYGAYEDGRIITDDVTTEADRTQSIWRVKATVYLSRDDQAAGLPKATGYAFEVDGRGMTQKANALETCETSAIGRALANMNLSGNKRATREEMGKADRQGGDTRSASQARAQERMKAQAAANRPPATKEQLDEAIKQAMMEPQSIEIGRLHYNRVKQMGASQEELDILAQSMSTLPELGAPPADFAFTKIDGWED